MLEFYTPGRVRRCVALIEFRFTVSLECTFRFEHKMEACMANILLLLENNDFNIYVLWNCCYQRNLGDSKAITSIQN